MKRVILRLLLTLSWTFVGVFIYSAMPLDSAEIKELPMILGITALVTIALCWIFAD